MNQNVINYIRKGDIMAKKAPAKGNEKELQAKFEKETGKKAIHCGKMTKGYKDWKANL